MNAPLSSSADPLPSESSALAPVLANAWVGLCRLRTYVQTFTVDADSGFLPPPIAALCDVLEQGCSNLYGRILFLAGNRYAAKPTKIYWDGRENFPGAPGLIDAYRRCCRRLGPALEEATRLGDAITTWLLSDLVQRLETQMGAFAAMGAPVWSHAERATD
jgi:hypothetical protein